MREREDIIPIDTESYKCLYLFSEKMPIIIESKETIVGHPYPWKEQMTQWAKEHGFFE